MPNGEQDPILVAIENLRRRMERRFVYTWLVSGAIALILGGALAYHLWTTSVPTSPEGVAGQIASFQTTLTAIDDRTKRFDTEIQLGSLRMNATDLRIERMERVIAGLILRLLGPSPAPQPPPRPSLRFRLDQVDEGTNELANMVLDLPLARAIKKDGSADVEDGPRDGMRGYKVTVPRGEERIIPVRAMAKGWVSSSRDEGSGRKRIEIAHGFGFRTIYIGRFTEVKKDYEIVERDGFIGSVKAASEVCLTVGIMIPGRDKPFDPQPFFKRDN